MANTEVPLYTCYKNESLDKRHISDELIRAWSVWIFFFKLFTSQTISFFLTARTLLLYQLRDREILNRYHEVGVFGQNKETVLLDFCLQVFLPTIIIKGYGFTFLWYTRPYDLIRFSQKCSNALIFITVTHLFIYLFFEITSTHTHTKKNPKSFLLEKCSTFNRIVIQHLSLEQLDKT